jgi:hypothetical protein
MGIAIMVFYIPGLFFLSWISGILVAHLFRNTVSLDSLRDWRNTGEFFLGLALATSISIGLAYWVGELDKEWKRLFQQIAITAVCPLILGTLLGVLARRKEGSVGELSSHFSHLGAGAFQATWFLPIAGLIYVARDVFASGMILAFIFPAAGISLACVALAGLSLRPILGSSNSTLTSRSEGRLPASKQPPLG